MLLRAVCRVLLADGSRGLLFGAVCVVRCVSVVVCCLVCAAKSLLCVGCKLAVYCYLMVVVCWWLLFVVACGELSFYGCYLIFVDRRLLWFAVYCLRCVGCVVLFVGRCVVCASRCVLFVVR